MTNYDTIVRMLLTHPRNGANGFNYSAKDKAAFKVVGQIMGDQALVDAIRVAKAQEANSANIRGWDRTHIAAGDRLESGTFRLRF